MTKLITILSASFILTCSFAAQGEFYANPRDYSKVPRTEQEKDQIKNMEKAARLEYRESLRVHVGTNPDGSPRYRMPTIQEDNARIAGNKASERAEDAQKERELEERIRKENSAIQKGLKRAIREGYVQVNAERWPWLLKKEGKLYHLDDAGAPHVVILDREKRKIYYGHRGSEDWLVRKNVLEFFASKKLKPWMTDEEIEQYHRSRQNEVNEEINLLK